MILLSVKWKGWPWTLSPGLSSFYLGVVLLLWSPHCFSRTGEGEKMRFRAAFPGTRKALGGQ